MLLLAERVSTIVTEAIIRNYVNYEKIPVKLIGSGRDRDYEHDGISHWSDDAYKLFGGYDCACCESSVFKLK